MFWPKQKTLPTRKVAQVTATREQDKWCSYKGGKNNNNTREQDWDRYNKMLGEQNTQRNSNALLCYLLCMLLRQR